MRKYDQKAIRGLCLSGLSGRQIADQLHCGINTVRRACKGLARNHSDRQAGSKHWNWKGGKKVTAGYVYLSRPGHPRATKGYVKRADLVLEEKLGRPLQPGEIAHHKNRNRSDDNPLNLEVKQRGPHQREHVRENALSGTFTGAHRNQPRDSKGRFAPRGAR